MSYVEDYIPVIKQNRGYYSKYPIHAPLTATDPTDGQLLAWSETLGQYTPVNPSGIGEIAANSNATGTLTSCSASGGAGTIVTVPSTSISISDSNGLSVILEYGAMWQQTTAGDGVAILNLYETTSGSTLLNIDYVRLPNTTAASISNFTRSNKIKIGVVSSTRTFEVRIQLVAPAANSPVAKVLNIATAPTFLSATTV